MQGRIVFGIVLAMAAAPVPAAAGPLSGKALISVDEYDATNVARSHSVTARESADGTTITIVDPGVTIVSTHPLCSGGSGTATCTRLESPASFTARLGPGNDRWTTEPGFEYTWVYGGVGNDVITSYWARGQDGDDTLDTMGSAYGDNGADRVTARDIANGGAGNDDITAKSAFGDSGADTIRPLIGLRDYVHFEGGPGDDLLVGLDSTSRDHLQGDDGHDTISAGSGPDFILGGTGDDWLDGGDGDDIFRGGLGVDHIIGGAGIDIARYDELTAVARVSLDGVANDGVNGAMGLVEGVENLHGTRGAEQDQPGGDILAGDAGPNAITVDNDGSIVYGWGGDDVLFAQAASVEMRGMDGNDSVTTREGVRHLEGPDGPYDVQIGFGTTSLYGGAGDDIIDSDAIGGGDEKPDTIVCGPGFDTAKADAEDAVDASCETVTRDTAP